MKYQSLRDQRRDYESAALPLSYLGLGGDSYLSIRGKLVSILRRDRRAIPWPVRFVHSSQNECGSE